MQHPRSSTSTITQADASIDRLFDQMATPLPTSAVVDTSKTMDSPQVSEKEISTQSTVVPRMKTALNNMMHPEHWTQGDTQTQMSMRPPPLINRALSRIPISPAQENPFVPDELPINQQPRASDSMTLMPEIAKELSAKKPQLRKTALGLSNTAASQSAKEDIVMCQCGHESEERDMVS
jgi:hypothetical protein